MRLSVKRQDWTMLFEKSGYFEDTRSLSEVTDVVHLVELWLFIHGDMRNSVLVNGVVAR